MKKDKEEKKEKKDTKEEKKEKKQKKKTEKKEKKERKKKKGSCFQLITKDMFPMCSQSSAALIGSRLGQAAPCVCDTLKVQGAGKAEVVS